MAFQVDLTDKTADDLDRDMFAPPGWCKCRLKDATEDNDTSEMVLTFVVVTHTAGNYAGCEIVEKLKNAEYAADEVAARKANEKSSKWAGRLGAIKPDGFGGKTEPDFISCIDNEYVLQLEKRSFTGKDGTAKSFTGPTYLGIFPLDHDKIPDEVRAELALPPAKPPKDGAAKPTAARRTPAGKPTTNPPGTTPPTNRGEVDVSGL